MCGICGIITSVSGSFNLEELRAMNETLHHRGPDGEGVYSNKDHTVGLGHKRLSILDLSENGKQPMFDHSKNYIISFNGEIYNHREIKSDLLDLGYKFKSNTDTETILNGYIAYGTDIFNKLNGIFSFAIYDRLNHKVLIVRDRLGVKPLYYLLSEQSLSFASEKKAILSQSLSRSINYKALKQYLYYGYSHKEETMYAGIKKLLPGHYLEIDIRNFELKKSSFWQHEHVVLNPNISEDDIIGQTSTLLEAAVKRQLQSDVPVGIFLSGGIDSSAITAFASKHYSKKLKTYSAAFDFNDGHNELALAKMVSQKFGTDHHEFFIEGKNLPEITEKLVYHHDEPFSDAANIPLFLMSQAVQSSCTVVLQGDGGDELFGGYPRYHLLSKNTRYKNLMKFGKWITTIIRSNHAFSKKLKRYDEIFNTSTPSHTLAKLLTLVDSSSRPQDIFSSGIKNSIKEINPFSYYDELYNRFKSIKGMDQKMMWIDSLIILPDLFLEKVDKSTMANSIEVRVPFLDNDLVDFALGLPSKLKLKKGIKKYLLKKALKGTVPDEILFGAKKGFGVPFGNWLKGPLNDHFNDIVYSDFIKQSDFFDLKNVAKKMDLHKNGKVDHSAELWKVYNLSIWLRNNKSILN